MLPYHKMLLCQGTKAAVAAAGISIQSDLGEDIALIPEHSAGPFVRRCNKLVKEDEVLSVCRSATASSRLSCSPFPLLQVLM